MPDPRALLIRSFRKHLDSLEALERKPGAEEEFVHQLRTGCKRLRALWRLARPSLPKHRFRHELRVLRNASRNIAEARERAAIACTLRRLGTHVTRKAGIGESAAGKRMGTKLAAASESFRMHTSAAYGESIGMAHATKTDLADSLVRLEELDPETLSRECIRDGIADSYRHARKTFRKTVRQKSASFHLWRKRIKDLWYQSEALRPENQGSRTPEKSSLRKFRKRIDKLQDELGELQDLEMLETRMSRSPEEFGGRLVVRLVRATLEDEMERLQEKTLRLGGKALRRKPESFSRKMGIRLERGPEKRNP